MRTRLTPTLLALGLMIFFACAALAAPPLPTRTSTQDGVTIRATPRSLDGNIWEFELVFDTHSQALKDDIVKIAVLSAAGSRAQTALKWQGDPPAGHHRRGILQFKPIEPRPASLQLRITRAGEATPRVFRWMLTERE